MKKLLFSILFAVGMIATSEAQSISFQVQNSSATDTWAFKVTDGNNVSYDLSIAPGGTVSPLTPAVWTSFVFPLTWGAANVTTGCSSNGVIPGYGGGSGLFPCLASMQYQLTAPSIFIPGAVLRVQLQ